MSAPRASALLLAAALLTAAALRTAHADPGSDEEHRRRRFELGLGAMIGSGDVANIQGVSAGLHTELAKHFGDLALVGEYNMLGVGTDPLAKVKIRGMLHHVGLLARYNLMQLGKSFVSADFWAEAGLGRETILWDEGGRLTRNDISIGIGAHPMFHIGGHREIGYYLAFRVVLAESPDARLKLPATCAGPCDEPTRPPTTDMSFYMNFAITFGK